MNDSPLFVALSKFEVRTEEMAEAVRKAFVERPHLVEQADGFVRLDVIRPEENPREIWLLTYWRDREAYGAWHKSHQYHDSHAGIPSGLKLFASSTQLRFFEHVAS